MPVVSKSPKSPTIYQLKISLEGARPLNWRRVLVPAGIRLDALHTVIQISMGWDDSNPHWFAMNGNHWSVPDPAGDRFSKELDERKFRLHELLARVGESLRYVYEDGDDLRHKVVLEKISPETGGLRRPSCLAGSNPAPPDEDDGDGYRITVAGVDAALAEEKWPVNSMR